MSIYFELILSAFYLKLFTLFLIMHFEFLQVQPYLFIL